MRGWCVAQPREVRHAAAEHEGRARNDRTSLIRPSACRIGYMARCETSNKNPALTSFLKLLRERYPLLSPARVMSRFGIEWRAK